MRQGSSSVHWYWAGEYEYEEIELEEEVDNNVVVTEKGGLEGEDDYFGLQVLGVNSRIIFQVVIGISIEIFIISPGLIFR